MAEIVIKRGSATHTDPVKNIRGCYKHGDIIDILDDGLADTMPHLTVIKIPNLDKDDILSFKESLINDYERKTVNTRRAYRIPSNIMKTLFPKSIDTQYVITLAQWNVWKTKIEKKLKV